MSETERTINIMSDTPQDGVAEALLTLWTKLKDRHGGPELQAPHCGRLG